MPTAFGYLNQHIFFSFFDHLMAFTSTHSATLKANIFANGVFYIYFTLFCFHGVLIYFAYLFLGIFFIFFLFRTKWRINLLLDRFSSMIVSMIFSFGLKEIFFIIFMVHFCDTLTQVACCCLVRVCVFVSGIWEILLLVVHIFSLFTLVCEFSQVAAMNLKIDFFICHHFQKNTLWHWKEKFY